MASKEEKIRKAKLDYYYRNKEAISQKRKEAYALKTHNLLVESVDTIPVVNPSLAQNKAMQKIAGLKDYTYLDFVHNKGFRPESQLTQVKSSIYKYKFNEDQQIGQRDLNMVHIKEPSSDPLNKPLGLRTENILRGNPKEWSKNGHTFASDYPFRYV